jgi:hypothetical protein
MHNLSYLASNLMMQKVANYVSCFFCCDQERVKRSISFSQVLHAARRQLASIIYLLRTGELEWFACIVRIRRDSCFFIVLRQTEVQSLRYATPLLVRPSIAIPGDDESRILAATVQKFRKARDVRCKMNITALHLPLNLKTRDPALGCMFCNA